MADSEEHDEPVPTTESDGNATAAQQESSVTFDQWRAFQDLLHTVLNFRTSDGRDPSHIFHRKVNKRLVPAYYEVIKEPIALSTIKARINVRQYKDVPEFIRDFALIPHNAQVYNRPESVAYQDALVIKGLLQTELKKLVSRKIITSQQAELPFLGEIPDVEDATADEAAAADEEEDEEEDEEDVEGEESDASKSKRRGRRSRKSKAEGEEMDDGVDADSFKKKRGRPPRVDTPMESRIKNVLKGVRKIKTEAGKARIAPFERLPDKIAMPEYFNEVKDPIAVDVIRKRVKRKKYRIVEHLLKDLDLMFENAKSYNEDGSDIFKDAVALQAEAHRLAAEELAKPDTDYALEDGRIPLPEGILHNGELFKVGDWIHIQNPNDLTKPIVSQIYRTWQDGSGSKFVNACWYYRPEQTVHRFDKHFYPDEVVKTGQYRDHLIDEIDDRCFVMFVTRFSKGRPRLLATDKAIYVCESRYNEDKHTFNKIKTWASCLPDEVRDRDYEMDLYSEPKRMKKIPSPIAYLLKDEQKESDELPKPQWASENAPPKIGAVHRRPKDARDSPPPQPTPPPPPVLPTPPPARANSGFSQSANQSSARYSTLAPGMTPRGAQAAQLPGGAPSALQPRGYGTSIAPQIGRQASAASRSSFGAGGLQTTQQRGPGFGPTNYGMGAGYGRSQSTIANMNYQAPQPVEVYKLNTALNAAIPGHIRAQFQCDEEGSLLVFTAPPLAIEHGEPNGAALGHSAEYLSAMKKRVDSLERKRKADASHWQKVSDEHRKAAKLKLEDMARNFKQVSDKARGAWFEGMTASNAQLFERTFCEQREETIGSRSI